jgi:putative Mn2+ efflux pump MntP
LATSLDALGVGFGFGLLISDLLYACLLIGLVAFVLTYVGMAMGNTLFGKVGTWAEGIGGAVLIFLGLRILLV